MKTSKRKAPRKARSVTPPSLDSLLHGHPGVGPLLNMGEELSAMREDRKAMDNPPANPEFRRALASMRANLPEMIEYLGILAKQRKAEFDALIAAGFTQEQALTIIVKDRR